MQINQKKLIVVILTSILALLAFFAVYHLYVSTRIEAPISTEIEKISSVQSVQIQNDQEQIMLIVHVEESDNIQRLYCQIEEIVQSHSKKPYQIKIVDHRDQALQEVYDELQLPIYEAVAKYDYDLLNKKIQQRCASSSIDARVFVDHEHLFIQMTQGDAFLAEVINLQLDEPTQQGETK